MADFSLAQPLPNFFGEAQNAFLAGQKQAEHSRTMNALAANASTPQNLPNALLQAGNLEGAGQAQQFNANASAQQYTDMQHQAQIAGLQRQGAVRQALQGGDVQGAYKAAAGDPDAMKMVDAAAQHVQATSTKIAQLGEGLKAIQDPAQRQAVFESMKPGLIQAGYDQKTLDGFQPTNDNIDAIVAQNTTLADQFTQHKPIAIVPGGSLGSPTTGQILSTAPSNPINVPAGGTLVRPGAPGAPSQTLYSSPYKPMTIQNADGTTSLVQPGSPGGGAPAPAGIPAEAVGGMLSQAFPGLQVSSAGRSAAHNAAVGGVPNSMHLSDQAVDVVLPKGVTAGQVHDSLTAQGLNPTEFINEGDHLHIGWAPKPQASAGPSVVASGRAGDSAPTPLGVLANRGEELAAQRYAAHDPNWAVGLPGGSRGVGVMERRRIADRAAELVGANGESAGDFVAGVAGVKANTGALADQSKKAANVQSLEETVRNSMGIVQGLAGPGLAWSAPIVNKWIQAGRKGIAGDADVSNLDFALNTLKGEYIKVMSGTGGTTEGAEARAGQLINSAQTPDQLLGNLKVMEREINGRSAAFAKTQTDLQDKIRNSGGSKPAPASSGWSVVSVK